MAEPKTRPTDADVDAFLAAVEPPRRRLDAQRVCALMREVTGAAPVMWGTSIVGFGAAPTSTGDWPRIAFAPRKSALVLYGLRAAGAGGLLERLGPVKTGGGCVYVTDLDKLDAPAVRELVTVAWERSSAA